MGSAAGPAKQGHMPLTAIVLVVVSEHSASIFFFFPIERKEQSQKLRPLTFCFQMPSGIVIQRSVHAQLPLKHLPVTAVGILLQSSSASCRKYPLQWQ